MGEVKVRKTKKHLINVVLSEKQDEFITLSDAEMDARATQAVKSAVDKAIFCKKPIAKYDAALKRAYVEYPDGVKKYVE